MNPNEQTAPRTVLVMQTLEDRTVPAGNVTVFVGGGVLNVLGDGQANAIRIDRTGGQSVFIRTLDGTTTINGQTTPQPFGDIANGYDIKLGDGNDTLLVNKSDIKRLDIDGGAGDDTITVQNASIRRITNVFGGDGNDQVTMFFTKFRGRTTIDLGAGTDRLITDNSRIRQTSFISGGDGQDAIFYLRTDYPSGSSITNFEFASVTRPPRAVDDTASVIANQAVAINVTGNDVASTGTLDRTTVAVSANPANGTVTNDGKGQLTYTSNGLTGTDTFTYTVTDSNGVASNTGTVTVNVTRNPATGASPALTLISSAPDTTNRNPIPFNARFDANVTGFTREDLIVTNGTVASFDTVGASQYSFTVTPSAEGPVSVRVAAGAAQDANGNQSQAAATITRTSAGSDIGMVSTVPDTTTGFRTTASGLGIRDIVTGSGNAVVDGSTVNLFYTGFLTDGTIFDSRRSSSTTETSPASFQTGGVIAGFREGLIGLQPGAIRQLRIPPELGYGAAGQGSIPPNATLIFEVKIISIA